LNNEHTLSPRWRGCILEVVQQERLGQGLYLEVEQPPHGISSLNSVQIEDAFQPGYDPALELARPLITTRAYAGDGPTGPLFEEEEPWTTNLRRKEQDVIDRIVHGEEPGHYFMFLGPKVSTYRASPSNPLAHPMNRVPGKAP